MTATVEVWLMRVKKMATEGRSSQGALGRWDHTGHAGIAFQRAAQGTGKGLEHGFALMVRIDALEVVDVQGDTRVVDEALKELVGQLRVETTDAARGEGDVDVQTGAAREVDDDKRQRFVKRHVGVAVAADALLVAHGLGKSLAQGDADVFH